VLIPFLLVPAMVRFPGPGWILELLTALYLTRIGAYLWSHLMC